MPLAYFVTVAIAQSRIFEGNTIENQPDFTIFLELNYELSVRGRPPFARLEWEFVGSKLAKYTDFVTQAQPFEIGDYHQLNLRAGMDFNEHVSIQAFVNNLTNEFGVVTSLDTGGLGVRVDCDLDDNALSDLVRTAVRASPLPGLLSKALPSLFTLSRNGEQIETGTARAVNGSAPPPPRPRFDALRPAGDNPGWVRKVLDVRENPDRKATPGSSLMAEQKRTLLLRGTCRLREDGVKEIHQEMFNPAGSDFVFLCDETEEFGGRSRAPDAVSYASAGIAFCFMTQLGRYAKILKKNLDAYDVIQDTHFPPFGGQDDDQRVDPVETHVYLQTDEDEAFARQALDLGEQTCSLHALCRTPLETKVKIVAV